MASDKKPAKTGKGFDAGVRELPDIETLRRRCEELFDSGDTRGWERCYREDVFPAVAARFAELAESDGMRNRYEHLILTVGMTAEPLMLSIAATKPKEVYFLYTQESRPKIDQVVAWCELSPVQFKADSVGRSDALDIYERIRRYWETVRDKKKIAIDITGGTKPMVSGGGIAAALLGIDVLYVDSQYGWLPGKSKPGSERLLRLGNPFDVFGDLDEKHAVELFNGFNFTAARSLLGRLRARVSDPRRFEVYQRLAEAYEAWDCFQYREAQEKLKALPSLLEKYRIGTGAAAMLERQRGVLEVLKRNNATSHFELMKVREFSEALITDMYCNALRRSEQGRYDDGIIRLYRALELISQHYLATRYGINTAEVTVTNPGILRKFSKKALALYRYGKELPTKIGLMDGWLLLHVLEDPITGFESLEELAAFMEDLRVRNELMIEHMNNPGRRQDFSKIKKLAEGHIRKAVVDFEGMLSRLRFLRLPL